LACVDVDGAGGVVPTSGERGTATATRVIEGGHRQQQAESELCLGLAQQDLCVALFGCRAGLVGIVQGVAAAAAAAAVLHSAAAAVGAALVLSPLRVAGGGGRVASFYGSSWDWRSRH